MPTYWRFSPRRHSVAGLPISALGLRLPRSWRPIRKGGENPNIIRSQGWTHLKDVAGGSAVVPLYNHPWVQVRCREHGCEELVPYSNYHQDLWPWYEAGYHPRWSILNVIIRLGAQYWETRRFLTQNTSVAVTMFDQLRKAMGNRQAFIRLMRSHVNTTLYARGRRYRVLPAFRAKYRTKSFTVRDFLTEENQELRRLILGRGVSVEKVVDQMAVEVSSKEGRILTYNNQRYLHVICPSTKQQYLLGIPAWGSAGRNVATPLETVEAARRWTFNLPENAVFAQEA